VISFVLYGLLRATAHGVESLMLMGRFEEAWAATQSETSAEYKRQISAMLAWSLGRRAESDRLVADIERPPTDAYTNAQIHTRRGENDLQENKSRQRRRNI
jgi:hypothetical protein